MPAKRNLKPRVKESSIEEYHLNIGLGKAYTINLCENHVTKIWNYADANRDKSRRYNLKHNSNNSKPRIWLSKVWHWFKPVKPSTCDFCNGKRLEDFL